MQVDVPVNGDPVSANLNGSGLTGAGNVYDRTLLFVDASVGRWLYRDDSRRINGLAAVLEAHYTSFASLKDPSAMNSGGYVIGDYPAAYNVLDLTMGMHAVMGNTTVTLGYAVPLTDDRGFDGELRFFVNRKF